MKKLLIFIFLIITNAGFAQDLQNAPKAVIDTSWKHSVIMSANITQISFTDWAQGGENALAYALFLEGKSTYAVDKIDWMNSYKFGYGQAKIGSQNIQKTDDKIDLESVLTYKTCKYINPFASVSLKTQFAEGVVYDADGKSTPVSDFFDPGYLMQTIGLVYQPMTEIKTRLGAALRETLAKKYASKYSDGEQTKVEGGVESVTEVGWTIMENVLFRAKLEIFAPIKNLEHMTVRSDNTLSAKINKYFSTNLNVYLLNDTNVQARTQVKQTLALGFSYTLM